MVRTSTGKAVARKEIREPSRLSEVQFSEETRIISGIEELDRVLGGGIVVGSLVLVGGDPGIGKSTLLLQMCQKLVQQSRKVLYVSGEESEKQIKMRAERLGVFQSDLLVMSETDLDIVAETITRSAPDVVIIDSIQTMYREEIGSAPGSVGQVRETTSTLLRLAKGMSVSIFIVGHVTKEGVVAGPRVLEHMVDTVLYFEGDGGASYRFLRGVKNRFGSTNEVGVFEMRGSGLVEVSNPSEFMLQGKPEDAPMRLNEPAVDMGIVLAILSSYRNQVIDGKTICFGEIGLVGEVRAVSMAEARVQEAAKLGFERCILPEVNRRQLDLEQMDLKGLKLIGISNVYELLEIL